MKFTRNFALEIFFSKYEFTVRYNVGGSDLQSVTIAGLLKLCDSDDRKRWDELYLGYTETYGAPELREAIAGTYDNLQPDNILCFAGAEEGIFATMQAILGPDDHAMVAYPNYQSAETVPCSICEVTGIPLDPERNWTLDIDFIKDHIKPNTKLISVNFPNNPTGKILEKDKFIALVSLCREHDIYLYSDEVYRLIDRSPDIRLPQAADVYEKAISLNVMSKAYGMAGLRIGWIATQDKTLLQKTERIKHFLSICNSAPSEFLATVALKNRDQILDRNRGIVDANLVHLNRFFEKHVDLFEWVQPDGGCVGYPRYKGNDGIDHFIDSIVNDLGVLFLPARIFESELGQAPNDRFRVGFGRDYFPKALDKLDQYLSKTKAAVPQTIKPAR
jgi:aspartate/methionine/tyrosine aminotransferase